MSERFHAKPTRPETALIELIMDWQLIPPRPEKQVFSPRRSVALASSWRPNTQPAVCQFALIWPPPSGPVTWVVSPKPAISVAKSLGIEPNGSDQRSSLQPPPAYPPR